MRRYSQTLRRVIPEFWTHLARILRFLRIMAETTPQRGVLKSVAAGSAGLDFGVAGLTATFAGPTIS